MKHIYLVVQLVVTYVLFTSCSPKKIFYLSKSTGSFKTYQEVQNATHYLEDVAIPPRTSKSEAIIKDSPVITASTSHLVQATLPRQKQVPDYYSSLPAKKTNNYTVVQSGKYGQAPNIKTQRKLIEPQTKKQVHEAALIGSILGLASVVILFAGSLLTFPFSLVGAVFGIIGLNRIKKKPEKFWGKGLAWVGIAVGILIPLLIVGYLLAFAGAF